MAPKDAGHLRPPSPWLPAALLLVMVVALGI